MPKLKLPGFTVSVGVVSVVPVPLRPTAAMLLVEELERISSVPVAIPVFFGVKCTWSVIVCFGSKVRGKLAPEIVKLVPSVTAAEVISTGSVPVDVRVTG